MSQILTKIEEIELYLESVWHFGECLLIAFSSCKFGYSVEFQLNQIWADRDVLRPDLDDRIDLVRLCFCGVQRLEFIGGLNSYMLQHPEYINWGLTEVSWVQVEPSSAGENEAALMKISFLWESQRRIEVEFCTLEVN